MIETTDDPRAVVSWEGADQPIVLKIYSSAGEVAAVRLSPTRALELARELLGPAISAVRVQ